MLPHSRGSGSAAAAVRPLPLAWRRKPYSGARRAATRFEQASRINSCFVHDIRYNGGTASVTQPIVRLMDAARSCDRKLDSRMVSCAALDLEQGLLFSTNQVEVVAVGSGKRESDSMPGVEPVRGR